MSKVQELTDQSFAAALSADVPVLVDFSATWCQPCKALAPTIEAIAEEYDGRLKVYKVDIDQAQQAAASLNIRSVPTCVFFKNGQEVERFLGAQSLRDVKKIVDKVLG